MRSTLSRRAATAAALCAAAALGLTACQGKGGDSAKDSPSAGDTASSASTGAPSATTAAARPLLTGTELTRALAPDAMFPAGFAVDPSATQDTGGDYQATGDTHPAKPDCAKLQTNAWIAITGLTGVSFTQQDRVDKARTAEIDQEIDVFKGGTAATAMERIGAVGAACPSFLDSDTRSKVTVTEKPLTGIGDGAYVITLTSPRWQSGTTLIAARVGTAVVTVLSGDDSGHDGRVTAEKVARHIAGQLKGKA
ncbi:hypothetical protein [Streptomyces sp. NPDC020917]|uniref:hypothetical protein n=1 Tax=Streptomyces sp. NPDC020917 TaxID=3365102 RepID=UPI00378BC5C4